MDRSGEAIAADSSTEGLGSPCCSLWRVDEARWGDVWRGEVWIGEAR